MRTKIAKLAGIALAVLAASPASAAINLYTSEASFSAALSSSGTDTFADLPYGEVLSPLARSAGAFGYVVDASGLGFPNLFASTANGTPFLSNNDTTNDILLDTFSGGVSAIGGRFYATDVDSNAVSFPAGLPLSLGDADGLVSYLLTNPNADSFFGFTSSKPLLSFSVRTAQASDNAFASISNLVLGKVGQSPTAPVPEPGTWMMMILGFGAIGYAMRRKNTVGAVRRFA